MQTPRKGPTISADPHVPSGDRGGHVETVLTLLEQISSHLRANAQVNISDDIVDQLSAIENILTHGVLVNPSIDHLDNEALYESQSSPIAADNKTSYPFSQPRKSVLYVRPQAGRAVVYTPRENYFAPVTEVSESAQRERSRRSREANDRRAVVSARDHAVETDCRMWVTLTFDDFHIDLDPVVEARNYLADISNAYHQQTGKPFHYLGVVAFYDARNHLHVLFPADIDPLLVRESWIYGSEAKVGLIDESIIEKKVRYMMKNVATERATYGRFLRSRGGRGETLTIPVDDFEEGREVLKDIVHPVIPRVVSAQPFGGHPRVTFRFPSIRAEEQQ